MGVPKQHGFWAIIGQWLAMVLWPMANEWPVIDQWLATGERTTDSHWPTIGQICAAWVSNRWCIRPNLTSSLQVQEQACTRVLSRVCETTFPRLSLSRMKADGNAKIGADVKTKQPDIGSNLLHSVINRPPIEALGNALSPSPELHTHVERQVTKREKKLLAKRGETVAPRRQTPRGVSHSKLPERVRRRKTISRLSPPRSGEKGTVL